MATGDFDLDAMRALHVGGQNDEAEHLFRDILSREPQNAQALYSLGLLYAERGQEIKSIELMLRAIASRPDFFAAYKRAARLNYRIGNLAEAARLYSEWHRHDPTNEQARHLAAATSGNQALSKASVGYVQDLFNRCAQTFDEDLRQLEYRGPEIIEIALRNQVGPPLSLLNILDGGCGTGLCGPHIMGHCRSLVGVDLSEGMIAHARQRGCYDELIVDELTAFMASRPKSFDVVVLADVVNYFGDLDELFCRASMALSRGGIMIATLEALDSADTDFRLQCNGRFVHSDFYLRTTLAKAHLEEVSLTQEFLRRESGAAVIAHLLVARAL